MSGESVYIVFHKKFMLNRSCVNLNKVDAFGYQVLLWNDLFLLTL